jgi:hypothetical protein
MSALLFVPFKLCSTFFVFSFFSFFASLVGVSGTRRNWQICRAEENKKMCFFSPISFLQIEKDENVVKMFGRLSRQTSHFETFLYL